MKKINFQGIEKKWQTIWKNSGIFRVNEESQKPKYYVLEQFPYPSGSGLHIGHAFTYTIGDIYARFKRMNNYNVLYPMGYDSLGLPAENAAIKESVHPKDYTERSIKYFSKQQRSLGLSYDWSRTFSTHDPEYYKWDQWIFLKLFERGLVYQKRSPVNWCPSCRTVLANEQVHEGRCWIHSAVQVEIKHLNQWYFRITKYAKELSDFGSVIDWPDTIKKLQKNWIGKSRGTEIFFRVKGEVWPIFTTRPDTVYGVTFMVISAQHPRLMEIVTDENKKPMTDFLKTLSSVSRQDIDILEKQGVFTGSYAINPINQTKVPIWAGNFVLADYGCGMIMAVPAHDQRDYLFAKKYNISIIPVIQSPVTVDSKAPIFDLSCAYAGPGKLINSAEFNGLDNNQAMTAITSLLEKTGCGRSLTNYKLRDWLVSRQRYWGTPIPIVHCAVCGPVPLSYSDLPLKLPYKVRFGEGNPLLTNPRWTKTKCPKCSSTCQRETDTMDTFVNSSWYYLRYCDNTNSFKIFDSKKANYWSPIDIYIGGKEHACMHDIYIRFYTKFLRDLGLIDIDEPAKKLFVQGMVHGTDGNKMSKSLGNVIDPLDIIKTFSADSLRLFLVSVASPESDFNWSDKGIESSYRFLTKVYNYVLEGHADSDLSSGRLKTKLNRTILDATLEIESFKYNLAIIRLRSLFDVMQEEGSCSRDDFSMFLRLLSVFCPHISEELWEKLSGQGLISNSAWPVANISEIDEKIENQEQMLETTLSDIFNIIKIVKEKQGKEIKKVYLYVLPDEISVYNPLLLSKRSQKDVHVFAVNSKDKYDPESKSSKARPRRPGIYVE